MKLRPLHDWAVIAPSEAETRTAGGLFIPDSAKEKPEEGVVEAIGPGAFEEEKGHKKKEEKQERTFVPTTVKPGDRVLYERYAGQNYKIGNEERILVRERDILGWIERPLQIPAATTSRAATALMERPAAPLMNMPKAKAAAKPSAKAAAKKAKKKTVKKAEKKAVKKAAPRSKKTSKAKSKKAGRKK